MKISQQIHQELSLDDIQEFFWSDSNVVLGYIANESCRFHVFVANRVQLIQDLTSVDQWKYIETKLNPADDASHGLSPISLVTSKWSTGPAFLWQKESEWPVDYKVFPHPSQVLPCDPEVKKVTVLATKSRKKELKIADRLEYFSDWFRARRAIALSLLYEIRANGYWIVGGTSAVEATSGAVLSVERCILQWQSRRWQICQRTE